MTSQEASVEEKSRARTMVMFRGTGESTDYAPVRSSGLTSLAPVFRIFVDDTFVSIGG